MKAEKEECINWTEAREDINICLLIRELRLRKSV